MVQFLIQAYIHVSIQFKLELYTLYNSDFRFIKQIIITEIYSRNFNLMFIEFILMPFLFES